MINSMRNFVSVLLWIKQIRSPSEVSSNKFMGTYRDKADIIIIIIGEKQIQCI